MLLPKEWSATVVMQVGQIYVGAAPSTSTLFIEPPSRAVERVKLGPFEDGVLSTLGLPLEPSSNAETDLIRSSTRATLIRNADLIEITVRGFSKEKAKLYAQTYEQALINAHAELAQPTIDRLKSDLQEVSESLAVEEKRKEELNKLATSKLTQNVTGKFSENVLLSELINRNDMELRSLRLKKTALQEQLAPARTFNTRPLGDIDISQRPVFPKKSIFAVLGVLLGLAIGTLVSLWLERRKQQR